MATGNDHGRERLSETTTKTRKPHLLVGAGALTATVWKSGAAPGDDRYRFNIVRTNCDSGRVTQSFVIDDLRSLTKLARVLAIALLEDGCLSDTLRSDLKHLAEQLGQVDVAPRPQRRGRPH